MDQLVRSLECTVSILVKFLIKELFPLAIDIVTIQFVFVMNFYPLKKFRKTSFFLSTREEKIDCSITKLTSIVERKCWTNSTRCCLKEKKRRKRTNERTRTTNHFVVVLFWKKKRTRRRKKSSTQSRYTIRVDVRKKISQHVHRRRLPTFSLFCRTTKMPKERRRRRKKTAMHPHHSTLDHERT